MKICDGELRTPFSAEKYQYDYLRCTRSGSFLFLPFQREGEELIWQLKNRVNFPELLDTEPELFLEALESLPMLMSQLEELFIDSRQILWQPEFVFYSLTERQVKLIWSPQEQNLSPEESFFAWAREGLEKAVVGKENDEKKLLLTARLAQAFDGSRSFGQSVSLFSDYVLGLELAGEEAKARESNLHEGVGDKIKMFFHRKPVKK